MFWHFGIFLALFEVLTIAPEFLYFLLDGSNVFLTSYPESILSILSIRVLINNLKQGYPKESVIFGLALNFLVVYRLDCRSSEKTYLSYYRVAFFEYTPASLGYWLANSDPCTGTVDLLVEYAFSNRIPGSHSKCASKEAFSVCQVLLLQYSLFYTWTGFEL